MVFGRRIVSVRRGLAGAALLPWSWLLILVVAWLAGVDIPRHRFEAPAIAASVFALLYCVFTRWECGRVEPIAQQTWGSRLGLLCIAGGAILYFAWSLRVGLLSDDYVLRQWAMDGTYVPSDWSYFRPLPLFLWSGLSWFHSAAAMHVPNLLLHGANVLLVGHLGSRLFGAVSGILAAVLFACLPTHAEPVAWAAGIFDLLAAFGVLLTLASWCSGDARLLVTGTLAGSVIAVTSKETALVLPVLLVLASVSLTLTNAPIARRRLFVWTCAAAACIVAWHAAHGAAAESVQRLQFDRYSLKELYLRPLASLAVPLRTDPTNGWARVCVALAISIATLIVARVLPRHSPDRDRTWLALGLAILWPLVTAAPLLRDYYVGPDLQGSRYMYLPSVGLAWFLAAAGARGTIWMRRVAIVLSVALAVSWIGAGQTERAAWQHAAALRDDVLSSARLAAARNDCRQVRLSDAPDNYAGAYVFRVGVDEALASLELTGRRECVARWDGANVQIVSTEVP